MAPANMIELNEDTRFFLLFLIIYVIIFLVLIFFTFKEALYRLVLGLFQLMFGTGLSVGFAKNIENPYLVEMATIGAIFGVPMIIIGAILFFSGLFAKVKEVKILDIRLLAVLFVSLLAFTYILTYNAHNEQQLQFNYYKSSFPFTPRGLESDTRDFYNELGPDQIKIEPAIIPLAFIITFILFYYVKAIKREDLSKFLVLLIGLSFSFLIITFNQISGLEISLKNSVMELSQLVSTGSVNAAETKWLILYKNIFDDAEKVIPIVIANNLAKFMLISFIFALLLIYYQDAKQKHRLLYIRLNWCIFIFCYLGVSIAVINLLAFFGVPIIS